MALILEVSETRQNTGPEKNKQGIKSFEQKKYAL